MPARKNYTTLLFILFFFYFLFSFVMVVFGIHFLRWKFTKGQNMVVSAKVERFITDRLGVDRVVLSNIYVDGKFFRDHAWIKSSKRFNRIKVGDVFTATAEMYDYIDVDTNKATKKGLRHFRNIVKM